MGQRYGKLVIDDYIIKQRDYSLMGKIFDVFTEISVDLDKRRNAFVYYGYSDSFDELAIHESTPEYIFIESEEGNVRFMRIEKEE